MELLPVAAGEDLRAEAYSDEELVSKILAGEQVWFQAIMRRYNQRLFRLMKAYVRDDNEAEDILQDGYVRAYEHLNQFSGRSKFSTWLTRIMINEALGRLRRRKRLISMEDSVMGSEEEIDGKAANPEEQVQRRQLRRILEEAVGSLPRHYRVVFMMREVEGMSTEETAGCLSIGEEAVKTRLFRARAMLRKRITEQAGSTVRELFHFAGDRCDRIVERVMARINR